MLHRKKGIIGVFLVKNLKTPTESINGFKINSNSFMTNDVSRIS